LDRSFLLGKATNWLETRSLLLSHPLAICNFTLAPSRHAAADKMGFSFEDIQSEYALTTAAVVQHGSVTFFQHLPLWTGSQPELGDNFQYIVKIALSAGIPLIAGIVVLVVFVALLISRCTCARPVIDSQMNKRSKNDSTCHMKYLVLSTMLLHVTFVFLALGILGVIILAESASNIVSSIDGLLRDVRKTGLTLMDFILWMRVTFEKFDAKSLQKGPNDTEGKFMALAFGTLAEWVPPRFPDVVPLRVALVDLMKVILDLSGQVSRSIALIFTAMLFVFGVCVLAVVLSFVADSFTTERPRCTTALLSIFLLIPLLLSWVMFAVWTGAGIGLAEGCRQLGEYRMVLANKNTTGIAVKDNLLIKSGLICPSNGSASTLQLQLDTATGSILDNPLATKTASLVLGIASVDLNSAMTWSSEEVKKYINCDVLLQFGGRMEELACGNRETSMVSGVKYIWLSFCLISIFLSCLFVCTCFGYPVTWMAMVWYTAGTVTMRETSIHDEEVGSEDVDKSASLGGMGNEAAVVETDNATYPTEAGDTSI
jgi:hypothetical protein